MRTFFLLTLIVIGNCAEPVFGTWKVKTNRSTFAGVRAPRSLSVRIEPHAKGEVFTVDRVESDGRATSSSSILYFDNKPRDLQDFECLGTQSSRRLDSGTIEIRRNCAGRDGIWFVRHATDKSKELMIDITEKRRPGPNLDWRLVLEKQ
jgi:hypothetical protein